MLDVQVIEYVIGIILPSHTIHNPKATIKGAVCSEEIAILLVWKEEANNFRKLKFIVPLVESCFRFQIPTKIMRLLCVTLLALLGLTQADTTFSVQQVPKSVNTESGLTSTSKRQYLRSTPSAGTFTSTSSSSSHRQNRELQSVFSIPYSLLWRIEIGNGFGSDRQPTEDEYEGVRQATVDWFNVAIADHYSGTEVDFAEVECELQTEGTSWVETATDNYPHKILLHCEAFFSAAALDGIPTMNGFVLDINTDYDFRQFVQEYLWNASPASSLFRFSQRVGYTLSDNGQVGPVGGSTTEPVPTAPTDAPVDPPSGPTLEFSGRYALPFGIAYNLALFDTATDREPTEDEVEGVRSQTAEWLTDSIQTVFADESAFRLDQVVVNVNDYTYTEALEFPYVVDLNAFVIFNADALSDLPSVIQFLTIISGEFDVQALVEDYIHAASPEDNLFHDTARLQYTTGTTTPAASVSPGELTPPPLSDAPQATIPPVGSPNPTAAPVTAAPVTAAPIFSLTPQPTPGTTMAPAPAPTGGAAPTGTSMPVMSPTTDTTFGAMSPLSGNVVQTTIEWSMEVGFRIPDRQPGENEYEGYRLATQQYLNDIYTKFYNDDAMTANVVGVQVSLLNASYSPEVTPTHQVTTKLEVSFDGDGTVPSEIDLLSVLSDANLMSYMLNYLHQTTDPAFSIFIGVRSVAWEATTAPVPTMPTNPTAPAPAPTAPAPVPTMPAPTMAQPTTTTTTSTNANTANLTSLVTVPVTMTMGLAINTDLYSGPMEPTEEEYTGLLLATKKFLTDSMSAVFASQPDTNFVGLMNNVWVSTSYTPGTDVPYAGEMQFSIAFMEGSTVLPESSQYWDVINALNFSDFIRKYLWLAQPGDSIFHYTTYVEWSYINV